MRSSKYRFGFNGKEKDADFQNNYDYGFRIYNPSIAKFLSVDPLTKSYPMLTPYQFASNYPIVAIDLDGSESRITVTAQYWENKISQAVLDNDIERASFLAFETITKTYNSLESDAAIEWAKGSGGWKDGKPAHYEYNKDKFPNGLTVVNAQGDLLFGIKGEEEHWYDPFLDLINETGGGYEFYTNIEDLNGQPIGNVRNGQAEYSIEIDLLMAVISGAKGSADEPKYVYQQIGKLIDAVNTSSTLGDELEIERRESYFEVIHCTVCDKNYKSDSTGQHHETSERASFNRKGHGPKEPFKKE